MADLTGDRDWRTRAVIAARPEVPATVTVGLVDDRAWQVRFALAANHHSDPDVALAITRAADNRIRMVLAQNTSLPEDVAHLLADDPHKDVRSMLAASTAHREVLERLLVDPRPDVRSAALHNPLVTTADLDRAAHDTRPDGEPLDLTDPQVLAHWPVTPSKPSTRWFRIFSQFRPGSDEIPDYVAWFWRYSRRIDGDSAWASWWAAAEADRLDVAITPGRTRSTSIERDGRTLYVTAFSPETWEVLHRAEKESDSEMLEVRELYLQALRAALNDVATWCDVREPPPLPRTDQPRS